MMTTILLMYLLVIILLLIMIKEPYASLDTVEITACILWPLTIVFIAVILIISIIECIILHDEEQ